MAPLFTVHDLAFLFGLLGNIVSFFVFLAPLPTFYNIYKKKSSEGYQAIPYSVALFSAVTLLFYAFLKSNAYMIISINGIGIVIEVTYLILYLIYAPKKLKISTLKLILLFNIGGFALVMLISILFVKRHERVTVVGWICAAFNLAVFAAPLSVMGRVIKTKSVEYMPFMLSFFLTLCAITWFFYGFFIKDFYIALPNVVGFVFGIVQMGLYYIYKDGQKNMKIDVNSVDLDQVIMDMTKLSFEENKKDNMEMKARVQKNVEEVYAKLQQQQQQQLVVAIDVTKLSSQENHKNNSEIKPTIPNN